jgi:hypothetical protein
MSNDGVVNVKINGKSCRVWPELTYEKIVEIALGRPPRPGENLSVIYKGGFWPKPEGILSSGKKIQAREGMTIKAHGTGNS